MKNKLLFILLMLFGLIVITGCATDNDESIKIKFYELKYTEPKEYTNVLELGDVNDKTKTYIYGEYEGSININYQKNKDYFDVESLYFNDHIEKEINGTIWRVMDDENVSVKSRFYYTVYNKNLYLIELNGIDKYQSVMEEFIKNISF